ncbi:unnamed protein product [Linum tenue]|uniref:Uncharacterized protein n=1 Tax=Linum tenue TaxID=586396 RepID=A0AAV0N9I7_9ROSI|nr:unnamed protein product [Linum tenue]
MFRVSSTETIKPSSPTPAQLATFKLSLMDNLVPPLYVPFIFFFYPAPASTGSKPGERETIFDTLRSSLAQTLTRFYPLAGRYVNEAGSVPAVHCNDEGVPFTSATVDGDINGSSLAEFLRRRVEIDSLTQFLPFPADFVSDLESAPQIGFRATAFPCGGLAIGVCFLHKIIDAATLADFMKLWSAVARSEEKTASAAVGGGAYAHNLAGTSLLPLRHDDVPAAAEDFAGKKGKMLTRRLAFNEEAIHALKAKAKSDRIPNPSRTEAVGGFLWKHVMSAAARSAASPDARSVVSIAGKLQGKDGRQEYMRNLEGLWKPEITIGAVKNECIIVPLTISSTIGMRLYDVDFGWGKPAWVTMARFRDPISNAAMLLQSPVGYGVEVWLTLPEKEMDILEQEAEFLTYAKNNISVL